MKNNSEIKIIRPFYAIILSIVCIIFSCESFVDIDPPNNQLTGEIVFEDATTVEASLLNIYAQLRDNVLTSGNTLGVSYLLGLYTDELTLYSSDLQSQAFFSNNLMPSNFTISNFWDSGYNLIYAANSIIQGVENSSSLTPNEKDNFLGEAYFIRAFIHFYLVNLYGNIPYITSTDYVINSTVSRLGAEEVYQKMISDLILSKSLLDTEYNGQYRARPNKWTAASLLARVYLYNQDWELASNEASEVITNGGYVLNNDLSQVFLKTSLETIWQYDSGLQGTNTLDAQTYIFNSGPPPLSALSSDLIDSFETNDERFSSWTQPTTNGTEIWYYPFKYKLNTNTAESQEYSIVIRLAELYFISAEANLQLGNISEALSNLNIIRNRANLASLNTLDIDEIKSAIYNERRIEFFTEMSHRFFDLKRTHTIDQQLPSVKPNWNATDALLPIPESELVLNPNLNPQNDGY